MATKKSHFTPFLKQCFVTSAVGINLAGMGSLTGFPAVMLPQLQLPDSDIVTSKVADSWIASSLAVTLLIGSFLTAPMMERFGRKAVHYIVCTFSIVGWLITTFAWNVEIILLARIIGGLSCGLMMSLRSILIGEYTSPKNRGAFLTTISLTQGCGIFFVHSIGSVLSWRKTAIVCLLLPLSSLIMTIFIPESPSWLVSKGRYEDCRRVFLWLRGEEEREELEDMILARQEFNKDKENKKLDIIGNIKKQEFYKPIILMLHMYAISHLAGAVITATYATTIIKLIMNPDVKADVWMVVLDSERIVVNILAIFIIHKVKRRTMVLSTIALCIASLFSIAAYVFCRHYGVLTYDILWIPGTLMVIHFFTIAIGMVPLPSVIAGEVFPLRYRSIGVSISLISTSINMFVLLKTFPALVESIGIAGAYSVYAGLLTYCMVVIWFLLPETKGRTLQDIEDDFTGRVTKKNAQEMQTLKNNSDDKNDLNNKEVSEKRTLV